MPEPSSPARRACYMSHRTSSSLLTLLNWSANATHEVLLERTPRCLAHFSYRMRRKRLRASAVNETPSSVSYGTTCPFCRSSQSCRSLVSEMRTAPSFSAAVHADPIPAMSPDPVAHELHNFPSVFARHLRLGAFDVRLSRAASKGIFHKLHDERLCRILHLMAPAVDAFLSAIARGHWKPGSPWVI
jgi:hypothetical protein